MVLIVSFLIAVGVMTLLGGRVTRLADLRLRRVPLVIGAALSTKLVFATGFYLDHPLEGRVIWIAGFLLATAFVVSNWSLAPLRLAAVGALCNGAVIVSYGGQMPIGQWSFNVWQKLPSWYQQPGLDGITADPVASPATSPIWFLGDILPPVIPWSFPFSIGDVLITVGVVWITQRAMFGRLRDAAREAPAEPAIQSPSPAPAPATPRQTPAATVPVAPPATMAPAPSAVPLLTQQLTGALQLAFAQSLQFAPSAMLPQPEAGQPTAASVLLDASPEPAEPIQGPPRTLEPAPDPLYGATSQPVESLSFVDDTHARREEIDEQIEQLRARLLEREDRGEHPDSGLKAA